MAEPHRPFTAGPFVGRLGLAVVLLGLALVLVPFRAGLGTEPTTDFLGIDSVPRPPSMSHESARPVSSSMMQSMMTTSVTSCGVPARTAFRSGSGNGWFNYSPSSGTVFSPGPPPFWCKAPAQRRVELGGVLVLAGLAVLLASRRLRTALPV